MMSTSNTENKTKNDDESSDSSITIKSEPISADDSSDEKINFEEIEIKQEVVEEWTSTEYYKDDTVVKASSSKDTNIITDPLFKGNEPGCSDEYRGEFSNETNAEAIDQKYNCEICLGIYDTQVLLDQHKVTHTGTNRYQCAQCRKGYAYKSFLLRHQRVHTGEQPYECGICSRKFSRKSNLVPHLRIHSGERPFLCEVCAATFTKMAHLKYHMRTHTPK